MWPLLLASIRHLSVLSVNKMLTKNSERKNNKSNGNNINSFLFLQNNQKSSNQNILIGRENAVELKLKISILQFIRKLCEIGEKFGGYLQESVSVCVWHITPLLSQYEVCAL